MKRSHQITIAILIATAILIVAFSPASDQNPPGEINKELAECIGDNSILYTQLGCSACERQEELFGEDYQYLNVVDCFYESDKCAGITATPTWFIEGEYYKGIKQIGALQEMTGCGDLHKT